mmetsp:Transcript_35500/g.102072  ORF Transcript_35500/g.102072 Transcript_35500/m.102072 type:complete len:225 (-) Transcript_35500:2027-2701(-)
MHGRPSAVPLRDMRGGRVCNAARSARMGAARPARPSRPRASALIGACLPRWCSLRRAGLGHSRAGAQASPAWLSRASRPRASALRRPGSLGSVPRQGSPSAGPLARAQSASRWRARARRGGASSATAGGAAPSATSCWRAPGPSAWMSPDRQSLQLWCSHLSPSCPAERQRCFGGRAACWSPETCSARSRAPDPTLPAEERTPPSGARCSPRRPRRGLSRPPRW